MTQPTSPERHRAVGVFEEAAKAETAQQQLQASGFAADQISTDTQTTDPNPPIAKTETARSARSLALVGSVMGAMIGFLISSYSPASSSLKLAFGAPSLGVLFAAGIGALVGIVAGGAFGALVGVNIPKAATQDDREHLSHRYLVAVEGTADELERAIAIMSQQGAKVQ